MQPDISVGICTEPRIDFTLEGIYSCETDSVVTGRQKVEMSETGMTFDWNGRKYASITFEPTSADGDTFEIDGVTIGIKFHWEQKERQRFRGKLRLVADSGRITAINIINVEEYLKSVISSEMCATASLNLLRAHAVISRSWLMAQLENRNVTADAVIKDHDGEIIRWWDRSNHALFDVCADDHCQRYQGITRISSDNALGAVDDTCGLVLTFDGKICDARFSKCCGGMLERFSTCWEDSDYPYLESYRDDAGESATPDLRNESEARAWIESKPASFCNTDSRRIISQVLNDYDRETADFYRWQVEYTVKELSDLIEEKLSMHLGLITAIEPLQRGPSGRIFRLRITGENGTAVIGKELEIRRTLSPSHLYSSAFTVDRDDDRFIIRGAGWGHGVGLCQIGAAVMADKGYDFRSILSHYYKGAQLTKLY